MLMECSECGFQFDPRSPAKLRAGGRITTCPDCSEEPAVKYLGLQAGDGKQAGITVLQFSSAQDREKYSDFWKNNSGMHKSRACQLGTHLSADPGIQFKTIVTTGPMNHKGKL